MQAIILVGGKSSRMKSKESKVLLKKNGKSFMDYIIDDLKKQGIDDIILKTEGRKEFDKYKYNKIKKLNNYIPCGTYLISVGDIFSEFDLKKMIKFHNSHTEPVTALTTNITIPYGVIENDNWFEKPKKEISLGLFLVDNVIGHSIHTIRKAGFKTFKTKGKFVHLTTKEDYKKWKKQK